MSDTVSKETAKKVAVEKKVAAKPKTEKPVKKDRVQRDGKPKPAKAADDKKRKKYATASSMVDSTKEYGVAEAMDLLIKSSYAKFDETVEIHLRLGVDGRQADQQVRGTVVLPNGTGKSMKVLVIAKGPKADEAKAAGADFIGAEDIITKITSNNWLGFDVCITTPDMMGLVGRVAKILGPKGLMPNPKSGTVTMDVKKAVSDAKGGKVEYRLDKGNNVHCVLGKKSFGVDKLVENYNALTGAVIKAKPAAAKGQYVKNVTIASSMGPGIKVAESGVR